MKNTLTTACLLILSATAFTSISNNSFSLASNSNQEQLKSQASIFQINPIAESDIQYLDISQNFTNVAQTIQTGNGGDVIISNFVNLLYSEFLNPLLKANSELPIPPKPTNLESFFVTNSIETQPGTLQNHDGDSITSPWIGTLPSYPTTLAIVKILNILLTPLDTAPEFKQLAARDQSGTFNPVNGFFAQFINYILSQQLNAMLGWNHYKANNHGTNINTGMFDFDAGFQDHWIPDNIPSPYAILNIGIDTSKQTISNLSAQINNFMFLLDNYINFAVGVLHNLANITSDPTGQWLMLNNLTTTSVFHTPKLFDTAAGADGRGVIYDDQNGGAATIFTALPRFMINASYGDGPFNGITREWGVIDNHYMMLLHYNGLISGYLNAGLTEKKDFVHTSWESKGHYYAYSDTTALNNLASEQKTLGELVYLRAWNGEINYLLTNDQDHYSAICLGTWADSVSNNNLATNDYAALLVQSNDKINGLFTVQSLIKQFQQTFNPFIAVKLVPFANHFDLLWSKYNQYNYGFKTDANGDPVINPYVDLTTLFLLNPQALAPYNLSVQTFKTEQTTILIAMATKIKALYTPINLGFTQHVNGDALKYSFPNLRNDNPSAHGLINKAALYTFYADQGNTAYFNNFKLEQLAIQKEHQGAPQPHFPLLAIILIAAGAALGLGSMIVYFFQRARRSTKSITQETPTQPFN